MKKTNLTKKPVRNSKVIVRAAILRIPSVRFSKKSSRVHTGKSSPAISETSHPNSIPARAKIRRLLALPPSSTVNIASAPRMGNASSHIGRYRTPTFCNIIVSPVPPVNGSIIGNWAVWFAITIFPTTSQPNASGASGMPPGAVCGGAYGLSPLIIMLPMVSIRQPVVNQAGNRDRAEVHWKVGARSIRKMTARNLLPGSMCTGRKMRDSKSGDKGVKCEGRSDVESRWSCLRFTLECHLRQRNGLFFLTIKLHSRRTDHCARSVATRAMFYCD